MRLSKFNIDFEGLKARWEKFKIKPSHKALALLCIFIVAAMIPNIALATTEMYGWWSIPAGIMLPLGLYIVGGALLRRTGAYVLLMTWLLVLCALQIVLLVLYGNSIIGTDMFLNLFTTNPDESSELLANLSDSVFAVIFIYAPILLYAVRATHRKHRITKKMRKRLLPTGAVIGIVGALMLIPARITSESSILLGEVFPFNVLYNLQLCFSTQMKVQHYESTSEDFTYGATRSDDPSQREIYIYMIGEASRAENWQLYGYERATTPQLSLRNDIAVFHNVLTQSNTTHKSVPLFLSSVSAINHAELYTRKGLPALFSEAGFKTYFISNQSPQGAMVDKLANEADERVYIGSPRHDMQLLKMMKRIIESDKEANLLFILHCYGSHYSYHQRYPREYAHFQPDDEVALKQRNRENIVNSYDNSILYTDATINNIIEYISSLDVCASLLYCSDHGEDIFDDERERFLHASPTITYHQTHVPSLVWFSRLYTELYPQRVECARTNEWSPITTRSMFHTMASIASIESVYVDRSASCVSPEFDAMAKRYYLNDHNEAVPFDMQHVGLTNEDMRHFYRHGITKL